MSRGAAPQRADGPHLQDVVVADVRSSVVVAIDEVTAREQFAHIAERRAGGERLTYSMMRN